MTGSSHYHHTYLFFPSLLKLNSWNPGCFVSLNPLRQSFGPWICFIWYWYYHISSSWFESLQWIFPSLFIFKYLCSFVFMSIFTSNLQMDFFKAKSGSLCLWSWNSACLRYCDNGYKLFYSSHLILGSPYISLCNSSSFSLHFICADLYSAFFTAFTTSQLVWIFTWLFHSFHDYSPILNSHHYIDVY